MSFSEHVTEQKPPHAVQTHLTIAVQNLQQGGLEPTAEWRRTFLGVLCPNLCG